MGKLGDAGPPSPALAALGRCPFLTCVSVELPCAPVEPREVYLLPSLPHFRAAESGAVGLDFTLSVGCLLPSCLFPRHSCLTSVPCLRFYFRFWRPRKVLASLLYHLLSTPRVISLERETYCHTNTLSRGSFTACNIYLLRS